MEEGVPLHKLTETINKNRRTFLALGATGIAAFVFGKLFGNWFEERNVVSKAEFQNFTLTETDAEIKLTERSGEPIFIIDKESFQE